MKHEYFDNIEKKSIIGGFLIGFGGTVYLNMDNKIVAAFLFGLGLFTIINFELNLYTGKIGYLSKENWREILLTLIGNFIGTNLFAFLVLQTRLAGKFKRSSCSGRGTKICLTIC